tara:strand:+ start:6610 stop:7158 length:549 start_codon:yes stop_codon:yes gene_type:complete
MRIFIIGFNRTGTRSLDNFFSKNGLKSVHWDQGRLARKIKRTFNEGKSLLKDYSDYLVFSDMEDYKRLNYAHIDYYKELYKQYPNSKFILNIRDMENWIESRNNHLKGWYVIELCRIIGCNKEELNRRWRKEFIEHCKDVIFFFKNKKKKLIVFNIEKDDIDIIIQFIPEYKLDSKYYKHIK